MSPTYYLKSAILLAVVLLKTGGVDLLTSSVSASTTGNGGNHNCSSSHSCSGGLSGHASSGTSTFGSSSGISYNSAAHSSTPGIGGSYSYNSASGGNTYGGGYGYNGYSNNSANGGYGNNGYSNNSANGGYGNNGYSNNSTNGGYGNNGYSNNSANGGYGSNGYSNTANGYGNNGYSNNSTNGGYGNNGYSNNSANGGYGYNRSANNGYGFLRHSSTRLVTPYQTPPIDINSYNQALNLAAEREFGLSKAKNAVDHLQSVFDAQRGNLSDEDRTSMATRIAHYSSTAQDATSYDALEEHTRRLESEIYDKTMFTGTLLSKPLLSDTLDPLSSSDEPLDARPLGLAPFSIPVVRPVSYTHHADRSGNSSSPTAFREPPAVSLSSLFEQEETRLIKLHELQALGTFDIDQYSARILNLRNQSKTIAAGKDLSPRQDASLRRALAELDREISDQTSH